ncbi:MAG TPA: zf-HC2 domain-containing protein [Phycisphaerae bacterium]|nr:zf-HC2 domain-containing protein [Phycisphaerae bacterium]
MNCEQARNLFDAYLDGELSSALATELGAHRLKCPSCRQELALMEVAGHVVGAGADEPGLDDDFTDRLLACIEPTVTAPRRKRYRLIRLGGALAAAACLTLFVAYLTRPEEQVAGRREASDATPLETVTPEPPAPESPGTELEDARATWQQIEDTVRNTQQSSDSLLRFGQMTLLEMFDTLRLEALRDAGTQGAPPLDEAAGDDADDIEDI